MQGSVPVDAELVLSATTIVNAYLKRNPGVVTPQNFGTVVRATAESLGAALGRNRFAHTIAAPQQVVEAPAVSVRQSVHEYYVICLDCGMHFTTLRRHLESAHGLSPEQYRAKWQLPRNHPLVSLSFSSRRRAIATRIGLGNRRKKQ